MSKKWIRIMVFTFSMLFILTSLPTRLISAKENQEAQMNMATKEAVLGVNQIKIDNTTTSSGYPKKRWTFTAPEDGYYTFRLDYADGAKIYIFNEAKNLIVDPKFYKNSNKTMDVFSVTCMMTKDAIVTIAPMVESSELVKVELLIEKAAVHEGINYITRGSKSCCQYQFIPEKSGYYMIDAGQLIEYCKDEVVTLYLFNESGKKLKTVKNDIANQNTVLHYKLTAGKTYYVGVNVKKGSYSTITPSMLYIFREMKAGNNKLLLDENETYWSFTPEKARTFSIRAEAEETVYGKIFPYESGSTIAKGAAKDAALDFKQDLEASTTYIIRTHLDPGKNAEARLVIEADPYPISNTTISLDHYYYEYDGVPKEPAVTVTDTGTTLVEGQDYTFTYQDNTELGKAKVIVTGIGAYTGTATKTFQIVEPGSCIEYAEYTLKKDTFTYNGTEKKPKVILVRDGKTLTQDVDYTITYKNNIKPGTGTLTVKGIGDYCGKITDTFTIKLCPVKNLDITLSTTTYTFNWQSRNPKVTVKLGETVLKNNKDYKIIRYESQNAGKKKIQIQGLGNFTGSVNKYFTIKRVPLSKVNRTIPELYFVYTGKAKKIKFYGSYKLWGLEKDRDYTITYKNNVKPGKATATIKGIGNFSGTIKQTFWITKRKTFKWGKDNWKFYNSTKAFVGSKTERKKYRGQINDAYLKKLKSNLTETEYADAKELLKMKWEGSCFGMSVVNMMAKDGMVDYSTLQSGAADLHSLKKPVSNMKVSSLITYYQILQVKESIQEAYEHNIAFHSYKTVFEKIPKLLKKHSAVLVGFVFEGGGHAVLATDVESGSWTVFDKTYNRRLKVVDPNFADEYTEYADIYYSTKDYSWVIPIYYEVWGVGSDFGSIFNYYDVNYMELNDGGYLTGSTGSYIARLDAYKLGEDRQVTKAVLSTDGAYTENKTGQDDIHEQERFFLGSSMPGIQGYSLMDAESAYLVTQQKAETMDLSLRYQGRRLYAASEKGRKAIFDKAGYVKVEGKKAAYRIGMVLDEGYPMKDWSTIKVSGEASKAEISMTADGYILKADNMQQIKVNVCNKETSISRTFSTQYESALLYETSAGKIGVKVDTDGDGVYETIIND